MGPFSGRPFGGLRAAKEHAERDLGVFPFTSSGSSSANLEPSLPGLGTG
jgi:hypothetical protein